MAQLLYEKQSANVHLNTTRRHMRLCRQIKGGDKYAVRIEPNYNDLLEKQKAADQAKFEKEAAHDDVVLNDTDLDNSVRNLYDECKQYDRDNVGRPVLKELFPGGNISGVIYAPLKDEPDVVEELLIRMDALELGENITAHKGAIQLNIEKCREALAVYHEAIKNQKQLEAVEEIAKATIRRQYEFNYLDIAKEFGKRNADRFFPSIRSSGRKAVEKDETSDDEGI